MNNYETLKAEMLKRSLSQEWKLAKKEWMLVDMEEVEGLETCLCGHFPIKEVYIFYNKNTRETIRIGNKCVNNFIQKNRNFDGYKSIKGNRLKSINMELLDFAKEHGWISSNEYEFYSDIIKKRKLTEKQKRWKELINSKIIRAVEKR